MDSSDTEPEVNGDPLALLQSFLSADGPQQDQDGAASLIQSLDSLDLAAVQMDPKQLLRLSALAVKHSHWLSVLLRCIQESPATPNYTLFKPGSSVAFHIKNRLTRAFTLQAWIKLDTQCMDSEETGIDFAHIQGFFSLRVTDNRVVITLSNGEKVVYDSFNFENDTLYNVILVQTSSRTGLKFDMYIDGEFVQSVQTDSDVAVPEDLQIVIGNDTLTSQCNVQLVSFSVYNDAQPLEWIFLAYHLGPDYSGHYRDRNLTEALSYRAKNVFEMKMKESYIHTTVKKNGNGVTYQTIEDFSRRELLKFEQIHSMLLKSGKLNMSPESIVFHYHSRNVRLSKSKDKLLFGTSSEASVNGDVQLHTSLSFHSLFHSIGGVSLAFKIIESSYTSEKLCSAVTFLFELIARDWRNMNEFEMKSGYDVLATLLKTKKDCLDLKTLDVILKFIGYEHNSPIDSILINSFAYRSLILDFDIWKLGSSKEGKETFKFLLFQFTVFFQESKYSLYNINKLVKMRVIKRFLQAMKSESFDESILPVVLSSLLILIKANPSSEIMRSLSFYIVYALNKNRSTEAGSLQRACGVCALEALVLYVCDSSLINSSLASTSTAGSGNINAFYKKLAKTISIRWVLLLLDDPNPKVVKLSLRLLIRMLSISGPRYYSNFMHHSGLEILLSLIQRWWEDQEVLVIVFSGAFGIFQAQDLGSDLIQFATRLSKRGSRLSVVMPEFLHLVYQLLEHGVHALKQAAVDDKDYSDITFNLASFLNSFVGCFEITQQNVPCLNVIYGNDFQCAGSYLRIVDLLERLPADKASSELLSAKSSMVDKFSNFAIGLLFRDASETSKEMSFSRFVNSFKEHDYESSLLQRFIYPQMLDHLTNFEPMLPELFNSQKWARDNTIDFLQHFSDSIEIYRYDDSLYLRFLKVLGTLFEITQSSGSGSTESTTRLRKLAASSFLKGYIRALSAPDLIALTKELLFRQELYFHASAFGNQKAASLVSEIFHRCELYDDVELHSISINALRMFIIYRQDDIRPIIECVSTSEADRGQLDSFFEAILSLGDTEVIKIIKEKSLSPVFEKKLAKDEPKAVSEDGSSAPKHDVLESGAVKSFAEENEKWKVTIVGSENAKYYRHIQDHEDNLQFYISVYNKMSQVAIRLLDCTDGQTMSWVVDSTECDSRMRRRIVPEYPFDSYPSSSPEAVSSEESLPEISHMISQTRSASITSIELEESFEMVEDPGEVSAIQEDKNRKVLRSLYLGDKIVDLWNICQIAGLDSIESILILGHTHLYIMENYFHSKNGEILDIDDAPAAERDPYMQLILGPGQKQRKPLFKKKKNKVTKTWSLEKLTSVSKRQFLLRDVGLEFFFMDGSSFLVTCFNHKLRDTIYSKTSCLANGKMIDQELSQALKLSTSSSAPLTSGPSKLFGFNLSNAFSNHNIHSLSTTKKWQRGEISNFYYLMIINTLAGRTFNDLTQYPVFPWVIADYTSDELDLTNPNTFRDLTKPMGGQGSAREATFIERYEALASLKDPDAPPFHYGTHYSSAMIVTHFLIRLNPYVQSYLLLQGGKFDHADRLFFSIAKAWNSAAKENTTDVRELIPEFFYLPEFLENKNKFEFGNLQDGQVVDNVILPPWAKNDPKIFIQKNREALECPYVSSHLHEWIDLIFGFKQSGQAAIDSTNVFHHLSYNGAIDLDRIEDEMERRAMTGIIHNFGQTPMKVFTKPHPARVDLHFAKLDLNAFSDEPVSIFESKTRVPVRAIDLSTKDKNWKGRSRIFSNEDGISMRQFEVIGSLYINGRIHEELHPSRISVLVPFGHKMYLTGAEDGTINVWKYISGSSWSANGSVTIGRRESMSEAFEIKHDSFDFQAVMRGHLSPVVDIKVAPAFNTALSLDEDGRKIYVWDLVEFSMIRVIPTDDFKDVIKTISIANDSGNIVIASETELGLYTINGERILKVEQDMISCVEFAQANWTLRKTGTEIHHEYWQKTIILVIGKTSKVELVQVSVEDSSWVLSKLKEFVTPSGERVTAAKMMLFTEPNAEGGRVGKGELIAGDCAGNLYVWK